MLHGPNTVYNDKTVQFTIRFQKLGHIFRQWQTQAAFYAAILYPEVTKTSLHLYLTPIPKSENAVGCLLCFTALLIALVASSYIGAGVVRQRAIVGQGDVLLLPLLVQRAATSLPQDALSNTKKTRFLHSQNNKQNGAKFRGDITYTISSKCCNIAERKRRRAVPEQLQKALAQY